MMLLLLVIHYPAVRTSS